jgi:rare lipoprotein A
MGNGSLIPVSKPETYCELSRVERVGGSARLTPADAGAALRLFRGGLWALALSAILCGCGTMVQSPSYYPPVTPRPAAAAPSGASHIVRASWYGPGFDGRRATSGEVFNKRSLTAASRTLPLGSRVRVTDLSTGRSVVVKVNDRGPFVRGRSLDLSEAAARRIGVAGVARVKVTRLNGNRGRTEPVSATVPLLMERALVPGRSRVLTHGSGRLASSVWGNRNRSGRRSYAYWDFELGSAVGGPASPSEIAGGLTLI